MTKTKSKKTDSNIRTIPLSNGMATIVDADTCTFLQQYSWKAVQYFKSWYAHLAHGPNGAVSKVAMHRLVMNTPTGLVCHHRNRNTLDNRRANLMNITREEHQCIHKNNSLSIKYDSSITEGLTETA